MICWSLDREDRSHRTVHTLACPDQQSVISSRGLCCPAPVRLLLTLCRRRTRSLVPFCRKGNRSYRQTRSAQNRLSCREEFFRLLDRSTAGCKQEWSVHHDTASMKFATSDLGHKQCGSRPASTRLLHRATSAALAPGRLRLEP